MRGFAALGIVTWHQLGLSLTQPILGHAFKSVGLFFIISGFVLSYRYEEKLRAGLSPWVFAGRRLQRLYPLYLLGTLLGCGLALVGLGLPGFGPREALAALPAALCLWPSGVLGDRHLFPLDAPAWSLSLEIVASLGYAFLLPRLSNRILAIAAGAGFLLATLQLVRVGTLDGGWSRETIAVGFVRVLYGFPMGVLLHRLWRDGHLKTRARSVRLICLLFVLVIAIPPAGPWNPLLEVLISGLVWPGLVILAADAATSPREAKIVHGLAEPSFALYALHFPILVAFRHVAGPPGQPLALAAGVASFALAWLAAVAATRLVDRPVRSWVSAGRTRTRFAALPLSPN